MPIGSLRAGMATSYPADFDPQCAYGLPGLAMR